MPNKLVTYLAREGREGTALEVLNFNFASSNKLRVRGISVSADSRLKAWSPNSDYLNDLSGSLGAEEIPYFYPGKSGPILPLWVSNPWPMRSRLGEPVEAEL
ncbi:unnamed protein product [Parascedosporium putredinis]|uniref:Uncharacterized protein n=1 Tax=Parascedosporium putredinis TaxID=1442378 RepID=A0A9P1H0M3_9PEZI|nr:unnamed protein product [Parascedosporium putredinis]CAI7992850.1 unnamed protein product [Parascedosporium putredinis]